MLSFGVCLLYFWFGIVTRGSGLMIGGILLLVLRSIIGG